MSTEIRPHQRDGATALASGTEVENGETFLVFRLDGADYAMSVQCVREIITSVQPSPVPGAPDYIRGVVNLRGRILPLVDLRKRFGLPQPDEVLRECWIIMVIDEGDEPVEVGISVDSVCEVIRIPEETIDAAPVFNDDPSRLVFRGVAKTAEGVKLLLDADALVEQLRRDVQIRCALNDSNAPTVDAIVETG
ncbi:MAG: chemotaxis protein CheW [Planctomycetota bacterium]